MNQKLSLEEFVAPFRKIAATCSEDACLSIMEDCLDSPDPRIRNTVRDLYTSRLAQLRDRQTEIEHYEREYDTER